TKKFRDCKCARCVHPEAFGPDEKLITNYLGEESRRPALKEIVIQGGKKTASILLRSRNFKAPPSTEDLPDLGKENLFDELSDTNVENAPNFEINGNYIGDCEKRFYACEICGKGFTDSLQAQSHISGHKPNWLKCVFCGLSLNGRIALRQHYMSEHMDQSSSTFTCGGCFSVFPTRIHYEHHLLLLPEAHPCHVMDYRQDMYFDRPNISEDRNPPVNISHASERVLPVFKQQNGGNPRDFKRLMVTPLGVRSMAEIEKNMKSFLMVKEKPPSTKPLSKDHRKTVLEMCKRVRQKPEENIPEIRIYKKAPLEEEDEEEEFEPYGRKNNVKWDELLCNEAAAREFPDWPAGLRKEFDNTKRPKEYCAFLREKMYGTPCPPPPTSHLAWADHPRSAGLEGMFGITGNEDRKADQRTPKTPSKFDRGRFSVDSSVPIFTTDCDDGFMPFFPNPAFRGDPSLLNKTKDEFDIVREDHLFAVYEPNDGRNLELLSEPKTEVSEDAFEENLSFWPH
ncbi:unnamed protein product, partial [Caenorhabditis auriculariae]